MKDYRTQWPTEGVRDVALYGRRMQQFVDEVTVYPVSCEKLAGGRSDKEWLDQVLAGGAKVVQLRDKESNDAHFLEKAHYFRKRTREAGALFLVNNRLDIALLADADGIHVGQQDLPPDEIRKLAPDMIIGASCNSLAEVKTLETDVQRNQNSVSYFNIGPLFATKTKQGLHSFLGVDVVRQVQSFAPLPFTVMGGVKFEHIDDLVAAGAKRLAVVTALSQADDIAAETKRWVARISDQHEL